jgi:putative transcriptional regulator
LEEFGFDILVYLQTSLDIAAQKKALILIIKIFDNIDGFKKDQAGELKNLGYLFKASPLIIGSASKSFKMQDGVVYDRYGVNAITVGTLKDALAGTYPEKVFSKGRVIAEIEGEELQKLRKKKHVTAEELAEHVKLTRESIYMYQKGKMRVQYEIAKRIEDFLNAELIKSHEPFQRITQKAEVPHSGLGKKLLLFDFDVASFDKLNVDLIAQDPSNRIVLKESYVRHPEKIFDFSNFFKAFLAFVTEEHKKDLPTISKEELKEIGSKKEFLRLLKEKSNQ